jgi:hypothetical protein
MQLTNMDGLTSRTSQNGGSGIELNVPFYDCSITLCVPQLTLLIVGDLAFFADAIGKHGRDMQLVVLVLPFKIP